MGEKKKRLRSNNPVIDIQRAHGHTEGAPLATNAVPPHVSVLDFTRDAPFNTLYFKDSYHFMFFPLHAVMCGSTQL